MLTPGTMPRYVIHIGAHKTGTSYLQVLFRELSSRMKARGILYPSQWTGDGALGHVTLVARLRAGDDDNLRREVSELNHSGCDIVLLSAEDLSLLSVEQIATLKEHIGGHSVSVVFYCRRWLDLLPSVWQELIKHGRTLSLPEYVAIQLANPAVSTALNYALKLDKFSAVFGLGNLFIASYSNIVDAGESLAEHFFGTFLSWPDAPGLRKVLVNASLSLLDSEMIRILNSMHAIHRQASGPDMRVKYLRMRDKLELDIPFAAMNRHYGSVLLDENSGGLRLIHDEIFSKYGSRLLPPLSGREWFSRRVGAIKYINTDYLLEAGVVQAIEAAYARLQA